MMTTMTTTTKLLDGGVAVGVGVEFLNQRVYAGSMFGFIYSPPSVPPLDKPGHMRKRISGICSVHGSLFRCH